MRVERRRAVEVRPRRRPGCPAGAAAARIRSRSPSVPGSAAVRAARRGLRHRRRPRPGAPCRAGAGPRRVAARRAALRAGFRRPPPARPARAGPRRASLGPRHAPAGRAAARGTSARPHRERHRSAWTARSTTAAPGSTARAAGRRRRAEQIPDQPREHGPRRDRAPARAPRGGADELRQRAVLLGMAHRVELRPPLGGVLAVAVLVEVGPAERVVNERRVRASARSSRPGGSSAAAARRSAPRRRAT